MTTKDEIQVEFINRIAETHGPARENFAAKIAEKVTRATVEQLRAAADTIVRTKNIKTFPSFSVCLKAIQDACRVAVQTEDQPKIDGKTYFQMASDHMRSRGTGRAVSAASAEWGAWEAYFHFRQNWPQLRVMRSYALEGKTFTVPAPFPDGFDASAPTMDTLSRFDRLAEPGATPANRPNIPRWTQERAFEFLRWEDLAKIAAHEGWVHALVDFVRQACRMPREDEIPQILALHAKALVAIAKPDPLQAQRDQLLERQERWTRLIVAAKPFATAENSL